MTILTVDKMFCVVSADLLRLMADSLKPAVLALYCKYVQRPAIASDAADNSHSNIRARMKSAGATVLVDQPSALVALLKTADPWRTAGNAPTQESRNSIEFKLYNLWLTASNHETRRLLGTVTQAVESLKVLMPPVRGRLAVAIVATLNGEDSVDTFVNRMSIQEWMAHFKEDNSIFTEPWSLPVGQAMLRWFQDLKQNTRNPGPPTMEPLLVKLGTDFNVSKSLVALCGAKEVTTVDEFKEQVLNATITHADIKVLFMNRYVFQDRVIDQRG